MNRKIKRCLTSLLLACALLLGVPVPAAAAPGATGFPDVPPGAWYEDALTKLLNYTPGIINGIPDDDGVTRFHPEGPVLRGEFLKMSMTAAEGYTIDHSRDGIHWAGLYYTIALENNILIPDAYMGTEPMFPCTGEALQQPVSRYEMAVILTNACFNMQMETKVIVNGVSSHIPDYASISAFAPASGTSGAGSYTAAVEQAYGKGLLSGYADGSFQGDGTLSRAEAAAVIYRQLNWIGSRAEPAWVSQPSTVTTVQGDGGQSFAQWLQDGHLPNGAPDAEARKKLFGDENKTYFASLEEAEPYMETVTIPIWTIDKTGNKYGTKTSLMVHKEVAREIVLIFDMIYEDPEHFPIYANSVGCARFSDTMRHSWGCAVDINPLFNCECNFRNYGNQTVTCGYGWWPAGLEGTSWVGRDSASYHGTMTEPSPYSIAPGGSVVRAFAAYGWGWGGSGTNDPGATPTGWGGTSFDFMHFSVMPTGG